MSLPNEIIDLIFSMTDIETCLAYKRFYASLIFNKDIDSPYYKFGYNLNAIYITKDEYLDEKNTEDRTEEQAETHNPPLLDNEVQVVPPIERLRALLLQWIEGVRCVLHSG